MVSGAADRKVHLDFLRIFSIYLVLFNHTGTSGYMLFTTVPGGLRYWIYMALSVFCKIAVPVFFMISGGLLIPREESIGRVVKHRFLRMFLILVIFSVLSFLYLNDFHFRELDWYYFIKTFYNNKISTAYWYLYSYLAFLLTLPFLRRMARHMTNREFLYMFLLYFIVQMMKIGQVPVFHGEVGFNYYFILFFLERNIFFPLFGYFLENRVKKHWITPGRLLLLVFASVIAVLITCWITDYHHGLIGTWDGTKWEEYVNHLIFIPAGTVYLLAKSFFRRHPASRRTAAVLSTLGGCTFGIFLLEKICREETLFIYRYLANYLPRLLACLIWVLCACAAGLIVTFILKKIPGIKKLL